MSRRTDPAYVIPTRNHATAVDASEIRRLARNFADLSDELVAGVSKAHGAAVKVVYDQALTNASTDGRQASKAAHDQGIFFTRVFSASSIIILDGGTLQAHGDRHSPFNYAIGSEFGAEQDLRRRLQPRPSKAFGRLKNPKSKQYADLPQQKMRSDTMIGWNQFKPWRGNRNVTGDDGQMPGYWMWPAVRQTKEQVVSTFGTAAMKTVQEALNN
jgi:hypothetical protein